MMKKSRCVVFMAALFTLALGTMPLVSQQSWGAEGEFGPYELVPSWPQPMCGDGFQMGSTSGVWAVRSTQIVCLSLRGVACPRSNHPSSYPTAMHRRIHWLPQIRSDILVGIIS